MNLAKIKAAKIRQFKIQIAEAREDLRRANLPGLHPVYSAAVQNTIREEITYLENKLANEQR